MALREERGGCMCGAVRSRALGEPLCVVYCHCRDCRRATGAPVSVFAGYPSERVEALAGEPVSYESSPGVRRSFCGRCGTSLSYEDKRLPGEIYLSVGAFDAPERFRPQSHGWESQRLGWLSISDALGRHPESGRPRL
jgi:hypothetical protein